MLELARLLCCLEDRGPFRIRVFLFVNEKDGLAMNFNRDRDERQTQMPFPERARSHAENHSSSADEWLTRALPVGSLDPLAASPAPPQ